MGRERIIGVTGTVAVVPVVEVTGVGLGQVALPPFHAGVLDLGPLRLGIQAVLEVNAFAGRRLQIDFRKVGCTCCPESNTQVSLGSPLPLPHSVSCKQCSHHPARRCASRERFQQRFGLL
jgi:hypothetical protein